MDIGFFNEGREEFNNRFNIIHQRKLTIDDIKTLSICILKKVDEFCLSHDIQYSLAYGSLLGAIRHNGFIPWDDDIDILMTRPNYEKFVSEFPKSDSNLFFVASSETDKSFPYPLAKVFCNATEIKEFGCCKYGFGIDLFPIDKIPMNQKDAVKLIKQQHFFWNIFMIKAMRWEARRGFAKNLFMCSAKVVSAFISYSHLHKQMKARVLKYVDLSDYYLGCLFSPYGEKEIMSKDIFDQMISLPFGDYSFNCLKEYDSYLTRIYGNYMELPPEEKRISHHTFQVWWK